MNEKEKEQLLTQAKQHVQKVSLKLKESEVLIQKLLTEVDDKIKYAPDDIQRDLAIHSKDRYQRTIEAYKNLTGSPYFVRCDVKLKGRPNVTTFYFAKHSFNEESIYSWIVPAAGIRFENPGPFAYSGPGGMKVEGELLRKDNFTIVDGKILFMSTESKENERQLVHQEFMPTRKSNFMLPEIVEQMEKSQDAVIRAHHKGSFLISGPAGSGKTTLALHRVAYLVQSPDTQELFTKKPVIVFVQDSSTKNYFGQLLPSLGIKDVEITTFDEWALNILGLKNFQFVSSGGDKKRDLLQYYKYKILEDFEQTTTFKGTSMLEILQNIYKELLPSSVFSIAEKQLKETRIDRFDLTLLLKIQSGRNEGITREKIVVGNRKIRGIYQRIKTQESVQYSLIIVDEVQNYLAEQINLFKSTISKDTQAMLYVGDLAQKTRMATLKSWGEINEKFSSQRHVRLEKVYRNTRQILDYINSLGFLTPIPSGAKDGPEVIEKSIGIFSEEVLYIRNLIQIKVGKTIGILTLNEDYAKSLKDEIEENSSIHVLTIPEAQGVEFDLVILAGIHRNEFSVKNKVEYPAELLNEKNKVNRDLIYVALTRAIFELHVLGSVSIKAILDGLNV